MGHDNWNMSKLYFMLLLTAVLTLCRASTGKPPPNSPPTTTVSTHSTIKPSNISIPTPEPFVTMSPPSKLHYRMEVTHSGPAVLDSTVFFNVILIPNIEIPIGDWNISYVYRWLCAADMQVRDTEGGLESGLNLTFPSENVTTGDYVMTVVAYQKDHMKKILAFQTSVFLLTEKLNGKLMFSQDLDYQRDPSVFATNKTLTLSADLYDHFQESRGLKYQFFWYKGKDYIEQTDVPAVNVTVQDTVNVTLKSLLIISNVPSTSKITNVVNTPPAKLVLNKSDPTLPQFSDPDIFTKNKLGQFEQNVVFKDELSSCTVKREGSTPGDIGVAVGEALVLNISCNGSSPSSVCVNITSPGAAIPDCKPTTFSDTVQHQVRVYLDSPGVKTVHLHIFNDISRIYVHNRFKAYDTDSVNVPALVLPVVFGVLGIVIVLLGLAYIMRLRKKPLVEVADFDFHPSLSTSGQSETSIRFSRAVNTIKHMFFRDKYQTTHNDPDKCRASTPLEKETTEPKTSFYGSL